LQDTLRRVLVCPRVPKQRRSGLGVRHWGAEASLYSRQPFHAETEAWRVRVQV